MKKFRNNNMQGHGSKGKPSTLMALLLVGIGAYYYLNQGDRMHDFVAQLPPYIQKYIKIDKNKTNEALKEDSKVEKSIEKKEIKKAEKTSTDSIPKYVLFVEDTKAFTNYENNRQVGVIQAGSSLNIIDYVQNDQGKVTWIKVKSDGLNVWIKNNNIRFKY